MRGGRGRGGWVDCRLWFIFADDYLGGQPALEWMVQKIEANTVKL